MHHGSKWQLYKTVERMLTAAAGDFVSRVRGAHDVMDVCEFKGLLFVPGMSAQGLVLQESRLLPFTTHVGTRSRCTAASRKVTTNPAHLHSKLRLSRARRRYLLESGRVLGRLRHGGERMYQPRSEGCV